ncbi:Protein tssc1 [Coemansia nantahalensis]|uniref:Protein tssc1 n=1 Tax=Coemansia nantahalensis TaxID=2789366 RepID=A0ACC1K3F8_9FUNG|nr:Protein tssc1 [Coemansia nantahalensis]
MAEGRGASHVYGIERHTLCLASVVGNAARNRFALGTLGISEPSEIHLVDFDDDEGVLQSLVYKHPRGVRALAAAPWDPAQLLVVGGGGGGGPPGGAPVELVALPDVPAGALPSPEAPEQPTALVAELRDTAPEAMAPHAVVAHPVAQYREAATVSSAGVRVWDMAQTGPLATHTLSAARHGMDDLEAAAWHPAAAAQLATADGMCVRAWDLRADPRSQQTMAVEYAHSGKVRCLDYNPNLPYLLATGGDDGAVRVWDARSPAGALLDIGNHTHWVYSVAFNPNHDQLLLSAGGDGLVNLESVVSASSAQLVAGMAGSSVRDPPGEASAEDSGSEDEDNGIGRATDGLVAQLDDHETSVYAARWSAADPWVFASLSFDGRLVINTVPQAEKLRILL